MGWTADGVWLPDDDWYSAQPTLSKRRPQVVAPPPQVVAPPSWRESSWKGDPKGSYGKGSYDKGAGSSKGGYAKGGYDKGGPKGSWDKGTYDKGGSRSSWDKGGYDKGGSNGSREKGGYEKGGGPKGLTKDLGLQEVDGWMRTEDVLALVSELTEGKAGGKSASHASSSGSTYGSGSSGTSYGGKGKEGSAKGYKDNGYKDSGYKDGGAKGVKAGNVKVGMDEWWRGARKLNGGKGCKGSKGGNKSGKAIAADSVPSSGASWKQQVVEAFQTVHQISVEEIDAVQYATEQAMNGFRSSVISDIFMKERTYAGEVHATEQEAEESAAMVAFQAEFPELYEQLPDSMKAAGVDACELTDASAGAKRKNADWLAYGGGRGTGVRETNPKGRLNHGMMVLKGANLIAGDIVYTTAQHDGRNWVTLTISCLGEPMIFEGTASGVDSGSQKEAEQNAAESALEALQPQIDEAMPAHEAKKARYAANNKSQASRRDTTETGGL